jgi:hypothetical protein
MGFQQNREHWTPGRPGGQALSAVRPNKCYNLKERFRCRFAADAETINQCRNYSLRQAASRASTMTA